jgi:uroporphyrin-III C-methyltransferase/precorrin-2 dehydrogenase/sirohydrochlorin ferrochelatase
MLALPLSWPMTDQSVVLMGEGVRLLRKVALLQSTPAKLIIIEPLKTGWPDTLPEADLIIVAFEERAHAERGASLARETLAPVNVVDFPDLSDFHIPAIIDRGTISIGVASGGTVPVLARQIRGQIEAAIPPSTTQLADWASVLSPHIRSHISDVDARRRFWEALLVSEAAELARQNKPDDATALAHNMMDATTAPQGVVHLVGAGTGDPELLTLKALRLLGAADVIIYDRLVSDDILALSRRDATRLYVGKERSHHSLPQEEIHALLVAEARAGKTVVRLKGGDPFIFGRGGEEADALKAAGVTVFVTPGISAAQGAAAATQTPLTHRDHANGVSFVTGHARQDQSDPTPDLDWPALAKANHTLVVYMGVHMADAIQAQLLGHGRAAATPVLVVENATRLDQSTRYLTLGTFAQSLSATPPTGPCVIIIGETVGASKP